ncbi:hypothetical protein DFP72DRAFT_1061171 [Ephemerocybe angulata]|uniref:Uncharacterized protein n=1 Tax=Ephemerocybe angulata TaxID=980116 RepID=A0A8H6MB50_9AGAR|nr:hypothetical protein DFP72DRAFT_1061171 [Tulosesus angulatus]
MARSPTPKIASRTKRSTHRRYVTVTERHAQSRAVVYWKALTGAYVRPLYTDVDLSARVRSTGYDALPLKNIPEHAGLEELKQLNFRLIRSRPNVCHVLVDKKSGKIWGVLAGSCWRSPERERVLRELHEVAEVGREDLEEHGCESEANGRGDFMTQPTGFSDGVGRTRPTNFSTRPPVRRVMGTITSHPRFKQLARFMCLAFRTFAPDLHRHMRNTILAAQKNDPRLRRPFKESYWPALTFNFGPRTICHPHVDFLNFAAGWCGITALGDFDWKRGGHLVLWELRLVIQFPPGHTVLIPSALVTHSNVDVAEDETRYSFTQYAAGSLFRTIANGSKTNKQIFEDRRMTRAQTNAWLESSTTWEDSVDLLRRWV